MLGAGPHREGSRVWKPLANFETWLRCQAPLSMLNFLIRITCEECSEGVGAPRNFALRTQPEECSASHFDRRRSRTTPGIFLPFL